VENINDYREFWSEKMMKEYFFHSQIFLCVLYCFEPGQEQKGHVHNDQDKVYLVLEGQGTFRVGGESRILGEGQGTMAPAGDEHGVVNHSTTRLRVLVFMAPNPG
jgi:quercetin dioxygenase-like cupin family protein